MSEPKIKYEIAADVTGQEDAQALTQNLQALGDVLDKELAHQARNAAQALQAIGDKRAALEQFSALKNEADALAVELAQAESGLRQVQQQLDAAATATQGYVRAEMQARAALAAKQQELASTRQELQQLNASTTGAARKTDEYRQAVDTARGTIQRLTAEIALEKTGLKQVQDQIKAATQEENALAAQRDKGAQALIQTRGALQDNAAALASAGAAAQRLGVDTANLSREEAALAAALRAQAPVLAAVNQEVVRLGQSQERTAQLSKEMQDAARKLGMEGIQAPKALEQAFLQLGMSGVKPAHKAIQELQIALAQIKASDVVDSQKQAAIAAFNQKVAELRGQASAAAGATQQLGQAAQGAGDQLGSAARTAAAWASALVGLQQLKGIATAVVDTGAQFETLHVRLSNLLGSTEAANQAFGMLKQLAASTPFDVAGLTESFVKLTAFGMKPTEAQMRSLADIAANLGGGTEALQGVTLALGQAWTKTKLQGEEIMQLAERGVPVWDALAHATGRTVPELQHMSEAGLLGRDVIAKLIDELGRMNAGASDKLMRTYAGAVSNAKDALAEFFDMVAKAGVLDWLTNKVRDLLAEFERMKQTGDLQQRAKQLADAFVTLANMAETAARAVATLAPVIKVAVEAMIALKAVQLGSALLNIAAGANAATVAVGATGVAAGAAAPALGLAAAGARGLGLALRAIPGAALLVALGEGAAWLAGKLFGPKASAEQSSKAIDDMLKERPVNGPQVAAQNIATAMTGVEKTTHDAVKAFDALIAKGEQVDAALSKIGKGFDLTTVPGIQGASAVLAQLLAESKITAEQFRDQWDKALKGIDLREFEALARHAFSGIGADSKQLQATIDAGLREAVSRAGLDFDLLANGVGRAAASSMHDLGMLIDNLDRLKEQGIDTGKVLSASLSKAIDTADSQKALDDVRVQIERVRAVLGEKVADGLLDQAKQKAEKLKEALDAATPGINSVAEAMKALGITSDESLRQTAKTAKEAYDTLAESGKASARELGEGFKKAAEAAIAANNGVAPAWVTAKRARTGQEVRMADIPADAGAGLGAFEVLHGFEGGAAFASHLARELQACHGAPGRAFLEWACANADTLARRVRQGVQAIAGQWVQAHASGQVQRVAARFALVAVAGELATEAGLTGWSSDEPEAAARACFNAWLAARGGAGNGEVFAMLRQVRRFLETHGEGRFAMWHRGADDHAPKTLQRAGVRRMLNASGEPIKTHSDHGTEYGDRMPAAMGEEVSFEYFVLAETFKAEMCQGFDHVAVCKVLEAHGCLEVKEAGRYTISTKLPGIGKARCYCIKPAIFSLEV